MITRACRAPIPAARFPVAILIWCRAFDPPDFPIQIIADDARQQANSG
jgi:hypothetical protein